MSLITLKTFNSPIDAHLAKAKLESENIPAFVFDSEMIVLNPLLSAGLGGVKLKVDDKHKHRAAELLQLIDKSPIYVNEEILHCPKCNSTHIDNDFKSIKSFKDVLSLLTSFLFFVFPLSSHSYYHCRDCNHTFKIKS